MERGGRMRKETEKRRGEERGSRDRRGGQKLEELGMGKNRSGFLLIGVLLFLL